MLFLSAMCEKVATLFGNLSGTVITHLASYSVVSNNRIGHQIGQNTGFVSMVNIGS